MAKQHNPLSSYAVLVERREEAAKKIDPNSRLALVPSRSKGRFRIELADHDGREWSELLTETERVDCSSANVTGPYGGVVEGSAREMLALAQAIRNRSTVEFKRCGVETEGQYVHFYCPRNGGSAKFTLERADELASLIEAAIRQ